MKGLRQNERDSMHLAAIVRDRKREIFELWRQRVLDDPDVSKANELYEPTLRDHIPEFLDSLVSVLENGGAAQTLEPHAAVRSLRASKHHAKQRTLIGYTMPETLRELSHLRNVITEVSSLNEPTLVAITLMHSVLDQAMADVADEVARVKLEAEKQHSQTREQFHLLVEGVRDYALFMTDPDGHIITWNPGVERILGYQDSEFIGQSCAMLYTPEDRTQGLPRNDDRQAGQDGKLSSERWHLRKDGSRIWAEFVTTALSDDAGELRGFAKVMSDRTNRKLSEDALRKSEERFRLFMENVEDHAIFMLDPNGLVSDWNFGAERIFGYTSEEIIGCSISKLFCPDDRAKGVPAIELARARLEGRTDDVRWHIRKDGSRFWANGSTTALYDTAGCLRGFSKVARDNTKDKLADDALRASKDRLQESQKHLLLTQRAAKVVSWDWDLVTDQIKWSGNAAMIYGVTPPLSLAAFLKHVAPEDVESLKANIERSIAQRQDYNSEYRITWADGSTHWVAGRGQVLYTEDGQAQRMVGVSMEITERIRAETERDRFFELSADPLCIAGFDGYLKSVNSAWQKLLGYSKEELMHQPWLELIHVDDLPATQEAIQTLLAGTATIASFETRLRHKGGSYRWLLWSVRSDTSEKQLFCVARDMTERRQAEAQFRTLADSIPQLAWMADGDSRISWFNRRWFEFTGLSAAEAEGSGWHQVLHPEHAPRVIAHMQESWQTGEHWEDSFPMRSKANNYHWFLSRALPIRDESGQIIRWFGTNTDITATREMEQRLFQSHERLKILSDVTAELLRSSKVQDVTQQIFARTSATLGLEVFFCYLVATDGKTLELSSTAGLDATFTSRFSRLKIGEYISGQVALDLRPIILEELQTHADPRAAVIYSQGIDAYACLPLLAGGRVVGTLSFGSRQRSRFEVEELAMLRTIADQVAIAIDRAQTEAGRQTAIADLEKARCEAEEANRAKSFFLANMSHEIRTPLGAMVGFGELLKDEALPLAERREFVDSIARNGRELTRLIDDILDLSKVEAGHIEIEQLPITLPQLVADVVDALKPKALSKGIEIDTGFTADVPTTIMSDPTRLRQILLNIMGNAVKFTSHGRVSIKVSMTSDAPYARKLKFAIKDQGVGLDLEAQQRLFQPFMQADSSTTRRFGGTGLGLVLARNLARALGGDVTLEESHPNQGSTFLVTINFSPYRADTAASAAAASHPLPNLSTNILAGIKILVAEDSLDNQVLVRRILQKAGAIVGLVDNGADAVQSALVDGHDLILMDIQMPLLDGYDATRELRRHGYEKPIIALTAHAMQGERDKCFQAGCSDYLTKPLNYQLLISTVAKYTGRKLSET